MAFCLEINMNYGFSVPSGDINDDVRILKEDIPLPYG